MSHISISKLILAIMAVILGISSARAASAVISSAEDFNRIMYLFEKTQGATLDIRLDADITIYGSDCLGRCKEYPYRGTFDGNGHTITIARNHIKGKVERPDDLDLRSKHGVFGFVENATIKNLHVTDYIRHRQEDPDITGPVRGVADCSRNSSYLNVRSTVEIDIDNSWRVGGVVGEAKDRTLYISTARYEAEGFEGGFTVGRSLVNAFKKLSTGQSSKLLFNEEYALECLFHEDVHSIYSPEKFVFHPKSANGIIAETCTQIYARRHYNEMIKAFDKNALFPNYEKIQTEGLGYKRYCGYARSLTKDNLTDKLLLSVIKEEVAGADVLVEQLVKKGLSKDVSGSLIYSLFRSR